MEKQIEEMRKDLVEIFDEEYVKRRIITADFPAIKMNAKSYRKQEWISVDERLPDIDAGKKGRYGRGLRSVRVLCACKQKDGRTFVKEGYYEPCANGDVVWRIPGSIDSVTHWMPLPEPPKMKGGAE